MRCTDCGGSFWRWRYSRHVLCPECAIRHEIEANEQIASKQGPAWEKTVRGQLRYWIGQARTLGIPLED